MGRMLIYRVHNPEFKSTISETRCVSPRFSCQPAEPKEIGNRHWTDENCGGHRYNLFFPAAYGKKKRQKQLVNKNPLSYLRLSVCLDNSLKGNQAK